MTLRRMPYRSLRALLRHELVLDEDAGTARLIHRLRHVGRQGWFSREDFLGMARWKSPRPTPHYSKNSARAIRAVSRQVLATRSERRRLDLLTSLSGVSVPVASAILTLIDPERYGVIDVRAWQVLHRLGAVRLHPEGRGFTFPDWSLYLKVLRRHARALGVPARRVEYTLFTCHRRWQRGRLYARGPSAATPRRARPRGA